MNTVDLSIVIPVYNSENILDELNQQISRQLGDAHYELILVNDKSKDSSWDKIVALSAINPRIKGISLKKILGRTTRSWPG